VFARDATAHGQAQADSQADSRGLRAFVCMFARLLARAWMVVRACSHVMVPACGCARMAQAEEGCMLTEVERNRDEPEKERGSSGRRVMRKA
jgi:hypothetical protein